MVSQEIRDLEPVLLMPISHTLSSVSCSEDCGRFVLWSSLSRLHTAYCQSPWLLHESILLCCNASRQPLCLPFISLAASVEVTHILLELLPTGTSQKEVTVTRFLLTSVYKRPWPLIPCIFSLGEICSFIGRWILWWLGILHVDEFYPDFFEIQSFILASNAWL